jgi:hypothetical protein
MGFPPPFRQPEIETPASIPFGHPEKPETPDYCETHYKTKKTLKNRPNGTSASPVPILLENL